MLDDASKEVIWILLVRRILIRYCIYLVFLIEDQNFNIWRGPHWLNPCSPIELLALQLQLSSPTTPKYSFLIIQLGKNWTIRNKQKIPGIWLMPLRCLKRCFRKVSEFLSLCAAMEVDQWPSVGNWAWIWRFSINAMDYWWCPLTSKCPCDSQLASC